MIPRVIGKCFFTPCEPQQWLARASRRLGSGVASITLTGDDLLPDDPLADRRG